MLMMNNAIPLNVAIFKEVTIEFVSANFILLSWTLKSVFLPKHIDTAKKTNPGIIEIHANLCVLAYNISLVLWNTAARMHTNTKVIINKIWQMTNMYARIRWNKVFPIISPPMKNNQSYYCQIFVCLGIKFASVFLSHIDRWTNFWISLV